MRPVWDFTSGSIITRRSEVNTEHLDQPASSYYSTSAALISALAPASTLSVSEGQSWPCKRTICPAAAPKTLDRAAETAAVSMD